MGDESSSDRYLYRRSEETNMEKENKLCFCTYINVASSSTILTVVKRVKQLNRLRIEKQQTWSKPISLSKTWTLTICLRLPYKSRAAAGGDLGPIGDSTNEDLHALSITFFKLAIKRAHNTISFYFYYKGEIMQWPLLSSSIE